MILGKPKKRVAYYGPEDTFSFEAAQNLFRKSRSYIPLKNFQEVVKDVIDDKVDTGIIPFFNPYEEHIRECQEILFSADLIATDVTKLDIDLCLASRGSQLKAIQALYSNEHVLKQCDIWLNKYLPGIKFDGNNSTAGAAQKVRKMSPVAAAVCSYKAASRNNLKVICKNIQNIKNFTLFFIIQKRQSIADTDWKQYSFFCFELDKPREQKLEILNMLKRHRLLSSQQWDVPHRTKERSLFFLEFSGSYKDLNVVAFEAEVKKFFPNSRIVGSFDKSIAAHIN